MHPDMPALVAELSDVIARIIGKVGNEDAGRLIHRLADDLGAPRKKFGPAGGVKPPTEPGPRGQAD